MNVAALTSSVTNRGLARFGWALLLVGAVFAAGNAVLFMTVDSHGHPGIKERFFATVFSGLTFTMAFRSSRGARGCRTGWWSKHG